jgi:predicted nucleic acid-binding protein
VKVVVDATPLIALSVINRLGLLQQLFSEVIVPRTVYQEVVEQDPDLPGATAIAGADWIRIQSPQGEPTIEPLLLGLDRGEMDALLLARELAIDWIIIDERLGRRVANALHLPVKGTIGILLAAAQAGLLTKSEAMADARQLADHGIRISARVVDWLETELGRL